MEASDRTGMMHVHHMRERRRRATSIRSATGAKPGVERGPRLRSERADEALLSLLPGGQRLMEEPAARLGERSSSLAPGRPREDPDTPAPDQWPDGTVEGG